MARILIVDDSPTDIRVLSVGSVQIATKIIAADFETTTGHKIIFTIVSPDQIAGRFASNPYDMLIASVPVIAALDKAFPRGPKPRGLPML